MPSRIPGWLQTSIIRQVADYLPDTCTIKDRSNTSVATNEPCAIVPETMTGTQQTGMVLDQKSTSYIFTVRYSTTLAINYKVVHGTHTYQIIELLDDRSPLLFKRARVQRIST